MSRDGGFTNLGRGIFGQWGFYIMVGGGHFCRGRVIFHFGFCVEMVIFLFSQGEGHFWKRVICFSFSGGEDHP